MTEEKHGIVVEIDERIAVTNVDKQFEAYCSDCKKMVEMAAPKAAAMLTGISEREVFRLIESREIHFIENALVIVCIESLNNRPAIAGPTGRETIHGNEE